MVHDSYRGSLEDYNYDLGDNRIDGDWREKLAEGQGRTGRQQQASGRVEMDCFHTLLCR